VGGVVIGCLAAASLRHHVVPPPGTIFDPAQGTVGAGATLTNNDLTVTFAAGTGDNTVTYWVRSSTAHGTTGKYFAEFTVGAITNITSIGLVTAAETTAALATGSGGLGRDTNSLGIGISVHDHNGCWCNNATLLSSGTAYSVAGDVMSLAINFATGLLWFTTQAMRATYGANAWNDSGTANPASGAGGLPLANLAAGPYYLAVLDRTGGAVLTMNTGSSAFSIAVPTGFTSWDGSGTGQNNLAAVSFVLTSTMSITGPSQSGSAVPVPNGMQVIDITASPYNADKTGAVDCSTAMQSAFTAAGTTKAVHFPAGTYRYGGAGNNTLNFSCFVYGDGPNSTILKNYNAANCALNLNGGTAAVLTNLQIQGNANGVSRQTTNQSAAVLIQYPATGFTVQNVLVNGSGSVGIFNISGTGGLIQYCTCENTNADSISNVSFGGHGAANTTVNQCLVINGGDDNFSIVSYSGSPSVTGITIQNCVGLGSPLARIFSCVGSSNCTFDNCWAENRIAGSGTHARFYTELNSTWSTPSMSNVTFSNCTAIDGTDNTQQSFTFWNNYSGETMTGISVQNCVDVTPHNTPIAMSGSYTTTISVTNSVFYGTYTVSNFVSGANGTTKTYTQSGNTFPPAGSWVNPWGAGNYPTNAGVGANG
jgi:hypothetical protein